MCTRLALANFSRPLASCCVVLVPTFTKTSANIAGAADTLYRFKVRIYVERIKMRALCAAVLLLACLHMRTVGSVYSADRLRSLRAWSYGRQARRLREEREDASLDYWKRLVGTPSRLGGATNKEGVLPIQKYSMQQFNVLPFQAWLRNHMFPLPLGDSGWVDGNGAVRSIRGDDEAGPSDSNHDYDSGSDGGAGRSARRLATSAATALAPTLLPPHKHAPLSYICGVYVNHHYKYIFIRNRKTASSTFISSVRDFMAKQKLCNRTAADPTDPTTCILRMDPDQLIREGRDPDAIWREYLVIGSSRNPWARAASGYEFTFEKWHHTKAGCAKPTFKQFARNPYFMGTLSNLFQCVGHREGVGPQLQGHWNFDFCHVEPAGMCMTDDSGRLVVDFMIRYEMLNDDILDAIDLINSRRPPHMPAITVSLSSMKWAKKGAVAQKNALQDISDAAYVYADHYRTCGSVCVDRLTDFFEQDLQVFGWDRPGRPPAGEERGVAAEERGVAGEERGIAEEPESPDDQGRRGARKAHHRLRGADSSRDDEGGDVAK